jgi:hypothetical protein
VESSNYAATIPAFKRRNQRFPPMKKVLLLSIFRQFLRFILLIPAIGALEFLYAAESGRILQVAFP